ncbi:hypothetical protein CBOM_04066 [Ceraceosorus bombacis]|uniref:Uncharacterized protein n=1 Tax=Ceraceosorus bombacis TaxID=401625 RepID=A0A0P1BPL9_9BASI|nr:hypothetical protein CBOM_04066 [Ceraceosorus bombacis]
MPSALGLAVREHEMTWSLEDEEPLEGAFSDADEERLTGDGNGNGRPSSFRRRAPGQDRQASLGSISSNGKLAAPVARRPGHGDALLSA